MFKSIFSFYVNVHIFTHKQEQTHTHRARKRDRDYYYDNINGRHAWMLSVHCSKHFSANECDFYMATKTK